MHALASSLLKTGRYRDTIAPDDLDTCIKIIRSARRHNATSQFSVRLLHKSQEPGGRSAKTLQHWLQTGRRDGDGPSRRCARRESTVLQGSSRPGVPSHASQPVANTRRRRITAGWHASCSEHGENRGGRLQGRGQAQRLPAVRAVHKQGGALGASPTTCPHPMRGIGGRRRDRCQGTRLRRRLPGHPWPPCAVGSTTTAAQRVASPARTRTRCIAEGLGYRRIYSNRGLAGRVPLG